MDYYDYLLESMDYDDYDSYDYDDLDPVEEAFIEGYMAAMEGVSSDVKDVAKSTIKALPKMFKTAKSDFKAGDYNNAIGIYNDIIKKSNIAKSAVSKIGDTDSGFMNFLSNFDLSFITSPTSKKVYDRTDDVDIDTVDNGAPVKIHVQDHKYKKISGDDLSISNSKNAIKKRAIKILNTAILSAKAQIAFCKKLMKSK